MPPLKREKAADEFKNRYLRKRRAFRTPEEKNDPFVGGIGGSGPPLPFFPLEDIYPSFEPLELRADIFVVSPVGCPSDWD